MNAPATVLQRIDPEGTILTPEGLALIGDMERAWGAKRRDLLVMRTARAIAFDSGERPGLLPETAHIRAGAWTVAPPPSDLTDRRCEITGPMERKMMISALNSGARCFMADFEDSLSPTWSNLVDGQRNLRDAADRSITFSRPDGSVDALSGQIATLLVRPRGLHYEEKRLAVDGDAPSASIVDASLAALHSAQKFSERGSGLYLYLPKLEHWTEAEWWEDVLTDLELRIGLPEGSIRTTVLIETILAAYQMEEILYALRKRSIGLNEGRWDYIFSIIKKFGADPAHVLPDRAQVTMTVPFMAAYAQRLVAICHKRGAHAIGGMSAFIPNRRNPEVTERALAQVSADKQREAALGYDGTWVAHPDLVGVATKEFDVVLGDRPNQVAGARPEVSMDVDALLRTDIPGGKVTLAGVTNNVSVALQYIEAWLGGRGAVAIFDLMEDAATAEISRTQLWQWIRHKTALDDGTVVTAALVDQLIGEQVDALGDAGLDATRLAQAADVVRAVALADVLPDFLTLVAAPLLAATSAGIPS
jgi:malate synthase